MAKILVLALQFLPLIFAILAFAFSLTATTSRDWSYRHIYDASADSADTYFDHVLYTQYRSPFQICDQVEQQARQYSNGTNYTVPVIQCIRYPAWGSGKTSCELASATHNLSIAQTTYDSRLCTQIHLAGNLSIAGTSFIGIGFFITLIMTAAAVALYSAPAVNPGNEASAAPEAPKSTSEAASSSYTAPPTTKGRTGRRHHALSPLSPYLNASGITFLILGAILTVLAQFYGVLAFTMSAPDNGKWTISDQGVQDQRGNDHEPWTQGIALTTYASLGWLFALFGATLAQAVWRLPRFTKVV